jgi:proline iminopeptidase
MDFPAFDGTRLTYRRVGTGPLLVCVPGGPGRAAVYLEDLGGLDRQRTLVLLDMRGTGESARPPDPATYAFPSLAADVEALRVHLGLARMDLLAHSAGTVVAQAYAARYPEQLRRLVLVTPGTRLYGQPASDVEMILTRRADEPWHAEAVAAFAALPTTSDAVERRRLLDRTAPAAYGQWGPRQQAHAVAEPTQFNEAARMGFWPSSDVECRRIVADLARVTARVLVVTGARDALTGVAAGDVVAGHFPEARHVTLDGCGHYPWIDAPGRFVDVVAGFLAEDRVRL